MNEVLSGRIGVMTKARVAHDKDTFCVKPRVLSLYDECVVTMLA